MAIKGFDTNYFVNALFDYAKEEYTEWATGKTTEDLEELLQNSYPDAADLDAAAEAFYADFGVAWGLAPNGYFDPAEYRLAWAEKQVATNNAFSVAQALTAYDAAIASDTYNGDHYAHYLAKGAALGVNPSNDFDESDYLQSLIDGLDVDMTVAELRELAIENGITPLDFFVDFPEFQTEYPAIAVTGDELVDAGQSTGSTFTLTYDIDKATANIFEAHRVWNQAGSDQLNSLNDDDELTGEGKNPTLNFTFVNDDTRNADYDIMPELNGIETINVAFTADIDQTLDLQDATGVKVINASRIDDGVDVNVVNIQEALTDLSISNSNSPTSNVAITFVDKALRSTENSLNLKLNNAQLNTLLIEEVANGDQGYETINLNSTGAANAVAVMTAEDIKSLIITGDENLTIRSLNEDGSLTTVDASALGSAEDSTAALDYTIDAGVMNAAPDGTSNGNVAFSLTATKNDDTVRISDQVGINDILAAGEGTDTIVMSNAATTTFFANGTAQATGFEAASIVRVNDVADNAAVAATLNVDLDQMSGDQTISLVNQESGDGNVTYNLDNATAAEATAITIMHSGDATNVAGDNGITQNIIDLDVVAGVTSAGVTIAEGINNAPRFNFTFTADSDAAIGETDVATVNTVANIAITDSDSESNSVRLSEYASHTGTITIDGGVAGNFINLDATGNAFGLNQAGNIGNSASAVAPTLLDTAFAAKYANTTYADITGVGVGFVYNNIGVGAAERIIASTIDASDFAGDLIVRVGEKNQTITTGTGNDTVIFDAVDPKGTTIDTAGLTISDKVSMGEGFDTIVVDGNIATANIKEIKLDSSEWTNLSDVDAIRLGNSGGVDYRLLITNSLITQTDAGDRITIINSDGRLDTLANSNAIIDLKDATLDAYHFVDFYGANGMGAVQSQNTVQVNHVTMNGGHVLNGGDNNVVQLYTAAAMEAYLDNLKAAYDAAYAAAYTAAYDPTINNTAAATAAGIAAGDAAAGETGFAAIYTAANDKVTTLDANLAWAVASGNKTVAEAMAVAAAENAKTADSSVLPAAILDNFVDANNNILEIYNNATITTGDFANVSNFGTVNAINNTSIGQNIVLSLTDSIVDSLVDASHAASAAQPETLKIIAKDNPDIAAAVAALNIQAGTLTAQSNLDITLSNGKDVIVTGAGNDILRINANNIAGVGTDEIDLGEGTNTIYTNGNVDLSALTTANFKGIDKIVVESGTLNLSNTLYAAVGAANITAATGALTVNNVAPNVAPVAVDDTFTITAARTFTFADLTGNDTDANGDALTIVGVGNATNGTVLLDSAAGTITFTPTINGTAGFTYTLSDGQATATGNVAITVEAPAQTYTLTPAAASVDEGANAVFNLATTNVADGTVLTYTITGIEDTDVAGGLTGNVTVNSDAGVITIPVVADNLTEGPQTMTVTVNTASADMTINDTSLDGPTAVSADIGTSTAQATLDADNGAFNFTDDATVANNVLINNFTADDIISVSNATTGYGFSNIGADVSIVYNDGAGTLNQIVLAGVVDAGSMIFDEATFETAIGFNAFTFV